MKRAVRGNTLRIVALVGVLVVMLGLADSARAQGSSADPKVDRVRGEIARVEGEISTLNRDLKGLDGKRKASQLRLAAITKEEQRLATAMSTTTRDLSESQRRVGESELRVFELQRRMRDRFRALYMGGLAAQTPALFLPQDWSDIGRMAVYTKSLNSADRVRLDEIRDALAQLSRERSELRGRMDQHVALEKEIEERKGEARRELERDQSLMDQMQGKKRQLAALLMRLKGEAERLETVVSSLTSQEDRVPPPTDAQRGYSGGLFASGIALVKPVRGKIVQGFGRVEVSEFADIVFSKGVEFAAEDGAQVNAVLGGTVAFSGTMPGYEKVVIISHGERSYSLYGSLEAPLVEKGDLVATGQAIGRAAVRGEKRRNFYFEVRRNGKPVDPKTVFKGGL